MLKRSIPATILGRILKEFEKYHELYLFEHFDYVLQTGIWAIFNGIKQLYKLLSLPISFSKLLRSVEIPPSLARKCSSVKNFLMPSLLS